VEPRVPSGEQRWQSGVPKGSQCGGLRPSVSRPGSISLIRTSRAWPYALHRMVRNRALRRGIRAIILLVDGSPSANSRQSPFTRREPRRADIEPLLPRAPTRHRRRPHTKRSRRSISSSTAISPTMRRQSPNGQPRSGGSSRRMFGRQSAATRSPP
jgi:hypothetical protein